MRTGSVREETGSQATSRISTSEGPGIGSPSSRIAAKYISIASCSKIESLLPGITRGDASAKVWDVSAKPDGLDQLQ